MTPKDIEKAIRAIDTFPAEIQGLEIEIGDDFAGDPAVWIWVVLRDEDFVRETRSTIRERLKQLIRDLSPTGDLWAYVSFRTASEVLEL